MQLSADLLVYTYSQGIFPMVHDDGEIYWYDPDPRAIIPLDSFHIPRSLRRTIRQGKYQVKFDTAFRQVMEQCAAPGPGREETWIDDRLVDAYENLHNLGIAHCVESWRDGKLVGGLYGVAIGGLFAGESMFALARDASKVALVHLVRRLNQQGFVLLDTQFMTDHLRRFGTVEISSQEYKSRLALALTVGVSF